MIHDPNNFLTAGKPLETADKVMVMVHGRGSSAEDMLTLLDYIEDDDFAFVAPQASGNTWYPHSFLRPVEENEPNLSSALRVLLSLRARLQSDYNCKLPQIYWFGFSQGACLVLEFIGRNPAEYGGVFGLSGGLIGPDGSLQNFPGQLNNTPVFLGCSDPDAHITKNRVLDTAAILRQMGASVSVRLYADFGHSINEDELNFVNLLIAGGS